MIDYSVENDCVGCPQGCINCGRKEDYTLVHIICDKCDYEEEVMYSYRGKEYCEECVVKVVAEDMTKEDLVEFVTQYDCSFIEFLVDSEIIELIDPMDYYDED